MKIHWSKSIFITFLLATFLLVACREEFNPEVNPMDTNLLVVEGYIAIDGSTSTIKLSRTGNLDQAQFRIESGAVLRLIGTASGTWSFQELEAGVYSISEILPVNQEYRLNIRLRNNETYESELLTPISTPELDEVTWSKGDSGVSIRVNTQGTAEAQYFLWQYEEDWIFRSAIGTFYRYDRETRRIEEVTPETDVSRCWNDSRIQRIAIENSRRFNGDLISDKEINLIPNLSEKLSARYSIWVKQYAIDRNAFDFWEIMRKNSEDIGGIFSPLPSLIGGNIKKVGDSNVSVIGYISMGIPSTKRIFITAEEVAPWPVRIPEYDNCSARPDTIPPSRYAEYFQSGNFMPVNPIFGDGPFPIAFRAAPAFCVDCTQRGTNVKPDFWED